MDSLDNITEPVTEPLELALAATSVFAVISLIQAFILFNGEYIWGISERAANLYFFVPPTLMFSLLGLTSLMKGKLTWDAVNSSLLAKHDRLSEYLKQAGWSAGYFSVGVQLIYFAVATALASLAFAIMIMNSYITPQITAPLMMGMAIITQVFLVVPSEEYLFRGIIPEYIRLTFRKSQYSEQIKYVLGATLFAVFHFAAYGGNWQSMGFAFAMGIVLMYAKDNAGLSASMGIHLAWNSAVLGLLIPHIGA
jgi:membrane protease YdiL (CAAX protease family)